ncbi:MAG: hypothetical protein DRP62_06455 [Planctomycetota bacterium]|nr:MAG: hypothetical protein DRP62_06455 [Planctomycetota bacterium]
MKWRVIVAFMGVMVGFLFCSAVLADIVVLKQGVSGYYGAADTYIEEEDWPGTNHGNLWYMHLYMQHHDPEQSALVKFDLTDQLPPNAEIQSATLSLWVYQLVDMTGNDWLDVAPYRVRHYKDWAEYDATWHIFKGSSLWATPGCESTTGDRFANPDDDPIRFTKDSGVNRYYHWDVTSSVQDWYAGTQNNNGWLIRIVEHDGGSEGISLNAKESDVPDYRPYLTITYIPDPATICLLGLGALALVRKRR